MKNSLLVSINIGLLLSYIFTYQCNSQIKAYTNDLPEQLLSKYKNIRNERIYHFTIGLIIAIVISAIFYKYSEQFSIFQKINIIIFLLLLLPMIVYKLLPKSDYMLNYSQKDQDYKDWFNIYLCMENKSLYGFLCGFTVSMIILSLIDID